MFRTVWRRVRTRLFSIDPAEVSLRRRGFRAESAATTTHLENVGRNFLAGYHAVIQGDDGANLERSLAKVEALYRGFAYEGAAMAAWLLDSLSLARREQWKALVEGPGQDHVYVMHVGVGWAVARLPWLRGRPERLLDRFDPLLGWLVIDGYGFHEGYFHSRKWLGAPAVTPALSPYARRVFDQGLGRCLWFVEGADVSRIAGRIATLDPNRHPDFWSGVGLASAYAGQASAAELEYLMAQAGPHVRHLAQGVTFGAEARVRGRIANEHTERTCRVVCGLSAEAAARLTTIAKESLPQSPDAGDVPLYELWRVRIRELLKNNEVPTCP